jgi:hypothetical protein
MLADSEIKAGQTTIAISNTYPNTKRTNVNKYKSLMEALMVEVGFSLIKKKGTRKRYFNNDNANQIS